MIFYRDGPPVSEAEDSVADDASGEPEGGGHDGVEHGWGDPVLEDLLAHGLLQVTARHDDGDDPQRAGEQHVERHQQAEKPPDRSAKNNTGTLYTGR